MENSKRKTVLVTGASGNQGGAVVKSLLAQNQFAIRALVREPTDDKARTLEASGVEIVPGDFDNGASLEAAMQGVYGVFSVQDFRKGADTEIRQGKAVADAALKTGVQHFVYSSVGSAERHTGIPHFESKYQVEEHIRNTGLPYTILRPVFFMYNYNGMRQMIEGGTLDMPMSSGTVLQQLSEDDYGEMVAEVFAKQNDFLGTETEMASTAISMQETVDIFSQVLNRQVSYRQVAFADFEKQVGEEATIMFRWFETVGYAADIHSLQNTFCKLSSLQNYLAQHGWNKS